jgi:amidophosphoribosyltransferase
VAALRHAGAREIHMRISCPPTAHPCFYGIDFPSREELIAGMHDVDEIREFLTADSLGYLSAKGLLAPFNEDSSAFCAACFTGEYPIATDDHCGKHGLERFNVKDH